MAFRKPEQIDYSSVVGTRFGSIEPSLAGPKRPAGSRAVVLDARNIQYLIQQAGGGKRFQQTRCRTEQTPRHPLHEYSGEVCIPVCGRRADRQQQRAHWQADCGQSQQQRGQRNRK